MRKATKKILIPTTGRTKRDVYAGQMRELHEVLCGFCNSGLWLPSYVLDKTRYCNLQCSGAAKSRDAEARTELTCTICKITKPRAEFSSTTSYCDPCHNAYRAERRRTNEQYRINNARAGKIAVAKRKEEVRSLKAAPCADCGKCYNPWQMQYDHVRGVKINNVSNMLGLSKEAILAEIAKCDLVCANCHAERTYLRLKSPSMPDKEPPI